MSINNYYLMLIFLCLLTIYYNVFINFFGFNYLKIKILEIRNNNNNILTSNYTGYNYPNKNIPIFMAKLENQKYCKIEVLNSVMIKNMIDDMKIKNIVYYTKILNFNYKICSVPITFYEILFLHLVFYFVVLMLSIITIMVLVFCCVELISNFNEKILNEKTQIEMNNEKENNDYICV